MFYSNRKKKIMSVAVASACSWMMLPASAQDVPAVADGTQQIVVVGFRAAAESALNIKRSTDGFVDVITADGLGRFPDLNVGEALTRIPGVQLDRTLDDRQARVSLRGLPGGYTLTTVNGMTIADPQINVNGAPLGVYSLDVFNRVVVNKSPGAIDQAGGIAGNIDLQFNGALARKDGGDITLKGEYNQLGGGTSPALTIKYNKKLTPDFAVFGTMAYKVENFRRDSFFTGTAQLYNPNSNRLISSYNAVTGTGLNAHSVDPAALAQMAKYYAAPGTALGPGEVAMDIPAGSQNGNTTRIVGTGELSKKGIQFLNNTNQFSRNSKGDALSISTGVEFKVNKNLKIDSTFFGADRNFSEAGAESFGLNNTTGGAYIIPDMSSVYISNLGQAYLNKYSYENPQVIQSSRAFDTKRNVIRSSATNAIWSNEDWKLTSTFLLSRGYSSDHTYNGLISMNPASNATPSNVHPTNGIYGSVDNGNGDFKNLKIVIAPSNFLRQPTTNIVVDTYNTAALSPAQVATGYNQTNIQEIGLPGANKSPVYYSSNEQTISRVNSVKGFQQSFERTFDSLPISSAIFGFSYQKNDYEQKQKTSGNYGVNAAAVTSPSLIAGTNAPNAADFFGGTIPGFSQVWPISNSAYALANVAPTAATLVPGAQQVLPPGVTTRFANFTTAPAGFGTPEILPSGFVVNPFNTGAIGNTFISNYRLGALYAQANIDYRLLGIRIRGNVGLRHEDYRPEFTYTAPRITGTGAAITSVWETKTTNKSYNYNLPSLILAAEAAKDVVVRAGVYDTYVRPARTDVSPLTVIGVTESLAKTTLTVDGVGNKTIQPYTARSYDLALEWYNRSGSVIALNAYRKSLKGQIYDVTYGTAPDLACPADGKFDGVDYGIGPLTKTGSVTAGEQCQVVNAPVNSLTGAPALTYLALGTAGRNKRNNTNTIHLNGIELNIQQNLSFLPSPWNNFGGSMNYSRTTYDGTLPNGTKVLIANTAKNNYNLVGYYDQGPFNFRLIFNKRGEALQSEDTVQPWNNVSTKVRSQIDLSTSWKFKNGSQISLDIANLTNALVEQYKGDPRMIQTIAFDGRTATVAFRAPF